MRAMRRWVRSLLVVASCAASLGVVRSAAADCASYCATVNASCTGENAQYAGADPSAQCLATCSHFAAGTNGEMSGSSVACREYWAGEAASAPQDHCAKAGPAGAGTCGIQCSSFCEISLGACTGTDALFGDVDTCLEDCFLTSDANEAYAADPADVTDSFRCRMYQLTVATTDATHCPDHGGVYSDLGVSSVCTEPLEPGPGSGGMGAGAGGESSGSVGGSGGGAVGAGGRGGTPSSASGFMQPQTKDEDGGCAVTSFRDPAPSDWVWWLALALPFVRRRQR